MKESLAGEIMDALNSMGGAVKTRGYPQDGRGQQGFCPLQMVVRYSTQRFCVGFFG